jgi:hypothetical protein
MSKELRKIKKRKWISTQKKQKRIKDAKHHEYYYYAKPS